MPSLRELNQNTFFSVAEIPDAMDSESAAWLIYGDSTFISSLRFCKESFHSRDFPHSLFTVNGEQDVIMSDNVTCEEFEQVR